MKEPTVYRTTEIDGLSMTRLSFLLVGVLTLAGVAASMVPASGQGDGHQGLEEIRLDGRLGVRALQRQQPADAALLNTCFPCHTAVKVRDFVFTGTHRNEL